MLHVETSNSVCGFGHTHPEQLVYFPIENTHLENFLPLRNTPGYLHSRKIQMYWQLSLKANGLLVSNSSATHCMQVQYRPRV